MDERFTKFCNVPIYLCTGGCYLSDPFFLNQKCRSVKNKRIAKIMQRNAKTERKTTAQMRAVWFLILEVLFF